MRGGKKGLAAPSQAHDFLSTTNYINSLSHIYYYLHGCKSGLLQYWTQYAAKPEDCQIDQADSVCFCCTAAAAQAQGVHANQNIHSSSQIQDEDLLLLVMGSGV